MVALVLKVSDPYLSIFAYHWRGKGGQIPERYRYLGNIGREGDFYYHYYYYNMLSSWR